MAEFPALPLWTDAYLADTIHLNNRESGAYLHLLMAAWRLPNCRLPNDDATLCRYARCSPREWARVKARVLPFFSIDENGLVYQKRLQKEFDYVRQKSLINKHAAHAKWRKYKGPAHADAFPRHMRNGCENDAPTPTPIKKEEIDMEKAKRRGGKFHVKIDSPQWAAWRKFYGGKAPPCDKDFGWLFPSEWPPGHGSRAP
jgi:uncharacterized protein YdaU (DUF1376 family)